MNKLDELKDLITALQKKEEEKLKRTEEIIWDLEKNLLVQADNIPKIWKIQ